MLNAVKSILADISSVSPSAEQRFSRDVFSEGGTYKLQKMTSQIDGQ